jgi:hypothetical protein
VNFDKVQYLASKFANPEFRRKDLLRKLVEQIRSGKYTHVSIDPHTYRLHSAVRNEYQHPRESGKLYPGQETLIWEMDAGSDEAP